MIIRAQDNVRALLDNVALPKVARARQSFDDTHIADVAAHTARALRASGLDSRIKPGMRVVLTAGSRWITGVVDVLRETADYLRELGAQPWIIPAMGSHGGATADGQRAILTHYGITEDACHCPIHASMDTDLIGHTPDGLPVYIDRFANRSDAIIPIGRVKAHTAFHAKYESGVMKMMTIGLGKQKGADSMHDAGFGVLRDRIPAFGRVVLATGKIPFAIAMIENAYDNPCRIEVLAGETIEEREPALLDYAKTRMARLLIPETDLLIVKTIGKNFSGSGMDPNISGTWSTPFGGGGITKQRVTVLDLSDESDGNALGIGRADTTTMRVFHKIDFAAMYPNILTSTVVSPGMIPMVLEDDEMAIRAAVKMLNGVDKNAVRIVAIRNTLDIHEILISEALFGQARETPGLEILEDARPMQFDAQGAFLELQGTH